MQTTKHHHTRIQIAFLRSKRVIILFLAIYNANSVLTPNYTSSHGTFFSGTVSLCPSDKLFFAEIVKRISTSLNFFFAGYNCPGKYHYIVMYHTAGLNAVFGTQYRVMFLLLSGQYLDKHKPVVVHVNNKLNHLTTTDVVYPKSRKAYPYLLCLHVDKILKPIIAYLESFQ